MEPRFTQSENRFVRELAVLAWERQLRLELAKIGDAIGRMSDNQMSPHDVNDLVHEFHNGISRDLFNRFSSNKPWLAVCRAHYDCVLTDGDIAGASEKIQHGINEFAKAFRMTNQIATEPASQNGGKPSEARKSPVGCEFES